MKYDINDIINILKNNNDLQDLLFYLERHGSQVYDVETLNIFSCALLHTLIKIDYYYMNDNESIKYLFESLEACSDEKR